MSEQQHQKALFDLQDVRKDFVVGKVALQALRGVNLQIDRGEFVALQGSSGSGKSTLLNVLGLIEKPTGGRLSFEGKPLDHANEEHLTLIRRRSVGFIFQNYNLVPVLTAAENVEYPLYLARQHSPREVRERAAAVLREVGLEKFARHKPAELSGGQRQRVAIARALVKDPHVILADEPTANLDSRNAQQIMELMVQLQGKSGTTIIVATHDKAVAAMTKRHVFIRDGVVVPSL